MHVVRRAVSSSNSSSPVPSPPAAPIRHKRFSSAPKLADPNAAPLVHGEHFEICHQIRDGHQFEHPDATRKADIVIVGGGIAGLSAAYFLRGKDWLLLEKEDHFGGNAYQEEFDGQPYATGSAYAFAADDGDQLADEIGLKLPFVNNPDPTIVNRHLHPGHLECRPRSTCPTPKKSATVSKNSATTF